ncbi:MAG: beta-propeller domain-containing protein [Candidatus Izimaplasma sp.]|nr:beta-propeller domain-containing protein [Candidatus Izimaplasma bacterium]
MSSVFSQPSLIFVMLVLIGLSIFFIKRFIDEYVWNKRLNNKKHAMRVHILKHPIKQRLALYLAGALSPAILVIIAVVASVNLPTNQYDFVRFNKGDDILDVYTSFEKNYRRINNWGLTDGLMLEENDLITTETADYVTFSGTGSNDYSQTNTQVTGVDEIDNVVTDGKYIYIAEDNQVKIALAYTEEQLVDVLSLVKTYDYIDESSDCSQGFYTEGLYVDDDYLVVIGSEVDYYCNPDPDSSDDVIIYDYYRRSDDVTVYVYDKNDNFNLETTYEVRGNFVGTRKIEDNLYIVTDTYLPLYEEDVEVDEYLPYYSVNNLSTSAKYQDILYIDGITPNSFTTFYALDLDHKQVDMEVILGDSGYNLYVSHNNMYLTGTIWSPQRLTDDWFSTETESNSHTAILKVAIDGPRVAFDTFGTIAGRTLNQFSMDEYNGVLRVATTTGFWGDNINNRVFMLDSKLNVISKLEELGKPGETIKSARFVGDYAYLVTFEQTDPFYVLDLSNPTNPSVLGELEITGFSSYLQPLGEKYMLGIGFGDTTGGTAGIKISIYDISDKTNPVVFDEIIYDYSEFGWAHTSVTYNHKDLLVSLSKGLIALPFTSYNYANDTYQYNSGILVFEFDEDTGLFVKGYVQHATNTEDEVYVYKAKFISDYFYTVSNKYIQVSTIDDPTTILKSLSIE